MTGIELSPHMTEQLRAKPRADTVAVTVGDMTTTRVAGSFKLVYLVANALMNVITQDEQLAVFANAATGSDGETRRLASPRSLGRMGPRGVHLGEPSSGRGLRENALRG